jgi:hypothetical protein
MAQAATPADWAGVNTQWLFPSLPESSWDKHLDLMKRYDVRVARLDAEWKRVEPDAPVHGVHTYNWSFYDKVVTKLAQRGIRWYPVVAYSAPWASKIPGQPRSAPAGNATYAEYASALVKRYGPKGAFWTANPSLPQIPVKQWEIWDEQNGSYFWGGTPDPAAYADLYERSQTAIKAVDPSARVVVGGLIALHGGDFLAGMMKAKPDLKFDAVALHAYAATANNALAWIDRVRAYLDWLKQPGVPIEVTEFGWTTAGAVNVLPTDAIRAQQIPYVMGGAAARPNVTRMIIHTWTSREQFLQTEDWFGMVRPDGTPTESSAKFAWAMRELRKYGRGRTRGRPR